MNMRMLGALLLLFLTSGAWAQRDNRSSLGKRIRQALRSTAEDDKTQSRTRVVQVRIQQNAWEAIEAGDSLSLPFRVVDGFVVIEAEADGDTLTMVFDTGGQNTLFNAAYHGRSASIAATHILRAMDGEKKEPLSIARFSRLRLGAGTYAVAGVAMDLSANEQRLTGVNRLDGLLCSDFVQAMRYEVHVDYGKSLLTFYRTTESGESTCRQKPKQIIPFDTLLGYLPLLHFTVAGRVLRLMFDTGCTLTALMPSVFDSVAAQTPLQTAVVAGFADPKETSTAVVDSVTLGTVVRHNVRVAKVNLPFGDADGMIGMDFFRDMHVSINYATRQFCIY